MDAPSLVREWFAPVHRAALLPRPRLTLSEWADQYRVLSRKSSSEPGRWMTDRAPYQRAIMDAITDPTIERVVFLKSAQVGATEILTNAVGYAIHQDPGPILVVQPNLDMARSWSTDRLKPMLRESPALAGRVVESNRRHSGDTILHKEFTAGHLTIVGANSASGLASRPIRDLYLDEVDRYPPSAGREGDPVALAIARTANFPNRKIVLASTPTIKGASRIELDWDLSDQRRYLVACPDCGHRQALVWGQLKWEAGVPESAAYACAGCGVLIPEDQKGRMLASGQWVATRPGARVVGFHVNALYSPWARWADLVEKWEAIAGDATRMQTFVNLTLGEPWEDTGGTLTPEAMAGREEVYGAEVPAGVVCLTAACDVQDDRLEYLVVGWGRGEESWRIAYGTIAGDPTLRANATGSPWAVLDGVWRKQYTTPTGPIGVAAMAVDSGHHTQAVYDYCRPRWGARVYAIKGASITGKPLAPRKASRAGKPPLPLYSLGVDAGKDQVAARLKIRLPGPGYMHTYRGMDPAYYLQVTAERPVRKLVAGRWTRRWEVIPGRRNEALDLEVYALAALAIAGLRSRLDAPAGPPPVSRGTPAALLPDSEAAPMPPAAEPVTEPAPRMRPRGPRKPSGGWLGGWRR
jgi:phage terminase large subunit GpA-like protein